MQIRLRNCVEVLVLSVFCVMLLGCGDTFGSALDTEAPDAGFQTSDLIPDLAPEDTAEVLPDVELDVTPDVDAAPDVVAETVQDVVGDDGSDVQVDLGTEPQPEPVPDTASEPLAEMQPETVAELAPEPMPEVAPETVPDSAGEIDTTAADIADTLDTAIPETGDDGPGPDDSASPDEGTDDGPPPPGFVAAIPPGTLAFMGGETCPAGWERATEADGRLLKATNSGLEVGVTAGTAVVASQLIGHDHGFTLSGSLGSKGIAAVSGCCNDTGAASGTHSQAGVTDESGMGLPMIERLLCRRLEIEGESVDTHPFPQGAIFFVDGIQCPTGWSPLAEADGRLVVSTPDGGAPGVTVGTPLASGVVPVHNHGLSTSISPSSISFAAFGGGNQSGASHSNMNLSGTSDSSDGGIAYIQYRLCKAPAPQAAPPTAIVDVEPIPEGVEAFYEGATCPLGWTPSTAQGTFVMALSDGGTAGATYGAGPLSQGEDRTHTHAAGGSFGLNSTSFAIAGGCCHDGFSGKGDYSWSTTSAPASSGVPYLTLTLCQKESE